MTMLGFARRVPLAVSGAARRFAQDPARGRAALERAVPALRAARATSSAEAVDRAVAVDRFDDAVVALAAIPPDDPDRRGCELAVAGLGGDLRTVATAHAPDARGRRAVRAARRQLAALGTPVAPVVRTVTIEASGSLTIDAGSARILHVVTNSLPVTQAGSTIRTQRIARAQRDLGWDAQVVTRPGYPVTHGDLTSANPEFIDGVPYHRLLPLVMPSDERMRETYVHLLGELVERVRPAVLHAASDHVNAAVALDAGHRRGLPVAYEARTFFEDMWLSRHGGEAARSSDTYSLLRARHTEVLLAADVVTTLGPSMRDDIVSRGVDPERVFIAPNAVPTDFLEPRDIDGSRARLGLPPALWIGSVATVNDDEGLDSMIHAVRLLRDGGLDARALIVGDGPGLPALRALARDLDVPLTSPGRIPVGEVRTWFDVLDVFALPRRDTDVLRTVTPLKPLEAQARGVPVVGSDLPAVAEVLAPGSRFVPPGDHVALAGALQEFADPGLRHAEGQAARDWIARTRTWPSVMEAYRSAYAFLGVRGVSARP